MFKILPGSLNSVFSNGKIEFLLTDSLSLKRFSRIRHGRATPNRTSTLRYRSTLNADDNGRVRVVSRPVSGATLWNER